MNTFQNNTLLLDGIFKKQKTIFDRKAVDLSQKKNHIIMDISVFNVP